MMTLKKAYEEFIEFKISYCDASTVNYYRQNLKFFFDYIEGVTGKKIDTIELSELDRKVMQHYVTYLRGKVKYEDHPFKVQVEKKGSLKNSTVRIYLRAVRVFFNYISDDLDPEFNVARKVRLPQDDTNMQFPLFTYEVNQIDQLFSQASEFGLRNLCIIHLMLDAGLRAEEVVALRVKDISFEKRFLFIVNSKNHKSRPVPLAAGLLALLKAYLSFRDSDPDEYFILKMGTKSGINYNVIKQLFYRVRNKTHIHRLHPHLLRHTFAVSYLVYGGNLEFLRDMLGHSDYAVTRLYVRMSNQLRLTGADVYRLDPVFYVVRS